MAEKKIEELNQRLATLEYKLMTQDATTHRSWMVNKILDIEEQLKSINLKLEKVEVEEEDKDGEEDSEDEEDSDEDEEEEKPLRKKKK